MGARMTPRATIGPVWILEGQGYPRLWWELSEDEAHLNGIAGGQP
jgi:hypothetical protein